MRDSCRRDMAIRDQFKAEIMSAPDQEKLEELQGKVVGDVDGALGVLMAYMGDQAGIYQAMEGLGQHSDAKLAAETGIDKRYLREWLSANVAFGYLDYQHEQDTFSINPEQAAVFARVNEAGFCNVRRATETHSNMVLEATL